MPNNVNHFAIHADDLRRARLFYESVFGWRFEPWGPPDFFLIKTGTDADPGIHGSLQKRRERVVGKGVIGFECTISVDSVEKAGAAIVEHGGKVTMQKMVIPTVGELIQFEDTEGNVVNAMRYDASIKG
jgi:predicted enzyme related to lactoylglutathione lyase